MHNYVDTSASADGLIFSVWIISLLKRWEDGLERSIQRFDIVINSFRSVCIASKTRNMNRRAPQRKMNEY